ncbi:MAG: FixH family protein [Candidatus Competibacteraceae bacterium]|uniref:FixH family protein n=1 Tax=Candidatus Contendobacter odensis Run_B_J11 TaxID=1400861 RepID=A0A7U7GB89_9GAMM|nr:FixH family protein [Candidatus Contendobacter odensis]MBK8537747.1 FixH family protein [Candidatus Competibacteraceae bacterium]CDH44958.1 putative FixH family protein [Candidatus Contendobacter odensis Run_B_J11]
MNDLLLGLALGVGLILFINLGLVRFARMSAKQAAAGVALATVGLYVPYSIVRWPGGDVFAIHLAIYLLASLACGMLLNARAGGKSLHWGPAIISGFFVVIAVLGAVFVSVAERGLTPWLGRWLLPETSAKREVTSVFPGVISHNFQKKEALYNEYLQQVERQRERGWQVQKGWLHEPVVNEAVVFRVAVQTREGEPVSGATVAGQFLRPSSSQQDIAFALVESTPGVYEKELKLPLAGNWNLVLRIQKGEDVHEVRALTRVLDR